ncbi:MAG: hypothetical protein ACO3XN_00470 [Chthoniobacterales bacterium]
MAGLVLRLLGIGICAAAWWWLGARGQDQGIPGGMLSILAAHGVLVVAAILLAKPLAGFIGAWLGTLFMPGERFDKPPPMYSIPEGRLTAEDYPGALEAFAELAAGHPEEITPHLRMMEIWLRFYRDPDSARTIRDNALLSIKGKKNRANFAAAASLLLGETPGA